MIDSPRTQTQPQAASRGQIVAMMRELNDKLSADFFGAFHEIQEMLREALGLLREQKAVYDLRVDNITLDSALMEELTGMSETTIYRWRRDGVLPFHVDDRGHYFYKFPEVYALVKKGKLQARSFNRRECLKKLRAYERGVLDGMEGTETDNTDYDPDEIFDGDGTL